MVDIPLQPFSCAKIELEIAYLFHGRCYPNMSAYFSRPGARFMAKHVGFLLDHMFASIPFAQLMPSAVILGERCQLASTSWERHTN